MKALVKYLSGPGNMEIREVPQPIPEKGQVKIQVQEAGICGSDLHIYHSDIAIPVNPPVITGHEFSGIISQVGEGVTAFKPGDRVVSETAFHYCGVCDYCRQGNYNLCVERKTLGYWFNGVFARYTVVPEARLHRIPDNVSFTTAAMTEPLACVVHAIYDLCKITAGDLVLVIGPGTVGIMAAQVAKAHGATVIVAGMDMDADRLVMAKRLGADYIINIQKENIFNFVKQFSSYGADAVLECSGTAAGIDMGLNLIKKRGFFTQIGLPGKKIEFDIEKVCFKEIHFTGSLGSTNANWQKALQLLKEEKVVLEPLAQTKLSIFEWQKAFEMFEKKEGYKLFLLPDIEE